MPQSPGDSARSLTQLVATQIRVQMAIQEIRQSQLARTIGKTDQWLSVRLKGRQPIDLNDLALIAEGLKVDIYDLLPSRTTAGTADTLRYPGAAEKARSERAARPPKSPKRSTTRPAGTTPKHDTRRPSMLPRPATA